jgi:steroid delta-isomerase-like uncharacterized protein
LDRPELQAWAERHVKAWSQRDAAALAARHAPHGVVESPRFGSVQGCRAIEETYRTLFRSFPDLGQTTHAILVDPPHVAIFATHRATHVNEFFGLPGTKKKAEVETAFVLTIENDFIVHERRVYDFTGLLLQVGVLRAKPARREVPSGATRGSSLTNNGESGAMTRDAVQNLVYLYLQTWRSHDPEALASLHSPDGIVESPMFSTLCGRKAIADSSRAFFTAFAEAETEVETILIDPPNVAQLETIQGTHVNELFGMPGTHRKVQFAVCRLFEFKDGLIAHERRVYDFTGLLVQVGVLKARPARHGSP